MVKNQGCLVHGLVMFDEMVRWLVKWDHSLLNDWLLIGGCLVVVDDG